MDTNSMREEIVAKARKPYTITKQREKWTEAEHVKFVNALKLYGRAWQRVEEHIGTKTAVQIRSHAQKFFTKMEKEANVKGMPFEQAHGFEIPPPRPKRKPNSPYPRKNGASSLSPFVEMMDGRISQSSSTLFHDKQATDIENNMAWKTLEMKGNSEDGNCSEVLNLFQDAPSSSFNGNVNGELKRACVNSQAISAQKEVHSMQSVQRYIKNVSIDLMKRSGVENVPATAVADAIPSTSGTNKTNNQSFPNFSQFFSNPDVSSIFPSEAASIDSTSSEALHGRISSSTNPRMAAIAAAIVSAAAAWWETQGLLPNHPSLHTDSKLAPDDKKESREDAHRNSLVIDQKNASVISELPAVDLNVESSTSEPTNLYYLQGFCVASAFRPYKRCLVESKEKRAAGSDDARKKKIRLEGETSI